MIYNQLRREVTIGDDQADFFKIGFFVAITSSVIGGENEESIIYFIGDDDGIHVCWMR